MVRSDLVSSGASSLLLSTVRWSILSFLLAGLAYLLAHVPTPLSIKPQPRSGEPPNILHPHIETRGRLAPSSFRTDARGRFENISPPLREGSVARRDTVAVVLNWSRFPNVRRIVSLLCSSELDSFMKRVLVWNNSLKPLTYQVRDRSTPSNHLLSNTVARTLSRLLVRKRS